MTSDEPETALPMLTNAIMAAVGAPHEDDFGIAYRQSKGFSPYGLAKAILEAEPHFARLIEGSDPASPEARLIDTKPKIGELIETVELEVGLHNPTSPNSACDCGDQLDGETFDHHVASMVDYRLTATDADA